MALRNLFNEDGVLNENLEGKDPSGSCTAQNKTGQYKKGTQHCLSSP